ncbi:MAG: DNA/RNA non-specific endonuclease [Methylococcaceae bacterium]|nr:DNA/RNA non-specific endonuclease [Methylococcaceae bacterium]MDP3904493.1 DNA/RNA non-specific endonuclease [Methylococcaceae bacterium]
MATKPTVIFRILISLFRFSSTHPVLCLVLISLGVGEYAYEVNIARPPLLFQGAPQAIDKSNTDTWFRILRNHGFILGYSDLRGNPLWVEYALADLTNTSALKRPSHFETDWRSLNRVSHDSFRNSGYDRGHMAPNHAISRLYGKQGQTDSFLMTNITPQKSNLNQRIWQRLEELEAGHFANHFGKIWVITGPIFNRNIERLPKDWTVEIPDAFFKIYITEATANKPSIALAFLIPQSVNGKEPLQQFITSIDDIETQTGLDFFSHLDDTIEASLESAVNPKPWHTNFVNKQLRW